MAAELITPLDPLSGMPLPLLPHEHLAADDPQNANWHHAWHAESAPELQTLGGKALRHSRVQLVRATDHNQGDKTRGKLTYHDFFIGPELPNDEAAQFTMCILSAAGYIPEEAIDLRGDEPAVTRMTDAQMNLLREPAALQSATPLDVMRLRRKAAKAFERLDEPTQQRKDFIQQTIENYLAQMASQAGFAHHHMVYRYQPMRDFFRAYVLSQDLSHIRETKVDEFLLTRDPERKLHLGRWLLAQAAIRTTDEVSRPYAQLRASGKLHPMMPPEASLLVLYKLGRRKDQDQLVTDYEQRLMTSLGIAA